ncbi:E3 ubiquitin-protein ligase RNF181-like [Onthophagus taurus]|uniref:E3 ubiquitin-protein ligase RNF181-like n=1 Tax=Onthophagus taurus TaxID=166361 RepID=UPI000C205DC5|nr:E3 ubiquitin-protein ligase RNF181-like [Onthophagus taurus]
MANYFDEMGWTPLRDGETPNLTTLIQQLLRDFLMFDENTTNRLPPPASKSAVLNLKTDVLSSEGDQCPICLKRFKIDETFKQMPCEHSFHPECIDLWLSKTNSCPLCRFELPTDDEDYEAYRKEKIRAKQREEELKVLHNSMFS